MWGVNEIIHIKHLDASRGASTFATEWPLRYLNKYFILNNVYGKY